jgi:hypothetical protein
MMIKHSRETLHLTIEQLNELMAVMLREIFLATFERRYGVPASDDIEKRVQAAHSMERKEWIPNRVAARHPEEIFTPRAFCADGSTARASVRRTTGTSTTTACAMCSGRACRNQAANREHRLRPTVRGSARSTRNRSSTRYSGFNGVMLPCATSPLGLVQQHEA